MSTPRPTNCITSQMQSDSIAVSSSSKSIVFTSSHQMAPTVDVLHADGVITISNITANGCDVNAPDTDGRDFKLLIHC